MTWMPIPEYEELYAINEHGEVLSLHRLDRLGRKKGGIIVKTNVNPISGYVQVNLNKNGRSHTYRLNVIVAKAFLGAPPPGTEVNHIDGNKLNNCTANLEYLTRSQNKIHAIRLGLDPHKGERHPLAKLKSDDVAEIKRQSAQGATGVQLAKAFGVGRAQISRILSGKRWL